jgi:putative peptidoglycan lipid II flippase
MKQTLQLGALSAINLSLVFFFQWYALTQLGPGIESDALIAGMSMPQLVLAIFSGSLMHVLVPLLVAQNSVQRQRDVWSFTWLIGALLSVLAVALFMTAPWWVPVSVPGFSAAGIALTIDLTRIQLIGMVFAAIHGVQLAAHHATQQFVRAETMPIMASTLALVLLLWALPRFGVLAVAWISTLRMVLQTLLLSPGMGKPIWPDFTSSGVATGWKRIKPLFLGTAYYKTDPFIDRFLLSSASSGVLSLYYLAQQIYSAINQVLNKAVAAPIVPLLSSLYNSGNRRDFHRVYRRRLLYVTSLGIFVLIFIGLIGHAILSLWAGLGRVDVQDVDQLWWIMICLGGVFIGGSTGQICSSAFYACGDTVTPTKMTAITYTLYIPCKVIAFYIWSFQGLALVTSLYYLVNTFLQILLLNKR